ncbi:hypothetical protein CsatB_019159 [Cannabis sativa]
MAMVNTNYNISINLDCSNSLPPESFHFEQDNKYLVFKVNFCNEVRPSEHIIQNINQSTIVSHATYFSYQSDVTRLILFGIGVRDPIAGSILTTQINNYIDIHINNLPFAAFKYVIVNIYIVAVTGLEQEQESRIIDSTFREALGVIPNVPATQESINKLKELNIKEGDDIATNNNCTICQENLLFEDMKVVEMPCSHLYHKNCIVSWLKIKHLCPLCRYSIPTATTAVENTVLDANTNSATLS